MDLFQGISSDSRVAGKALNLANRLVDTLPAGRPGLFNPYREQCPRATASNDPQARLLRLAMHLDCNAKYILCGEAPGYQGCRYSGIAFTSERLILDGAIPRVPSPGVRLSDRKLPFSEPSATIVWKTLIFLGVAGETVLWNALQMHPFRGESVWSNRTPTDSEISLGAPALNVLTSAFPDAKVIAVGKKAEGLLNAMGVSLAGCVRHPANGGASEFRNGISALIGNRL